jgi:nucleotide-binding universal stress UspA family protein
MFLGEQGEARVRAATARDRRPVGAIDLAILSDILCGVDGTRTAYEAVRQAASLTGPNGRLTLVAVTDALGSGRYSGTALAPTRAHRVLSYARRLTKEAGVPAEAVVDDRAPVEEVLLDLARHHSLLALGAPSMSRFAHIMVGGGASSGAHLMPASLLIARPAPAGPAGAERIIVASDSLKHSDRLVEFSVRLARERKTSLQVLHAAHAESNFRPARIERQAEKVRHATGGQARMCVIPGRARDVIVETAARERATLLVLSSRRLGGARALGSVSERVVHDAPCSVLVVRPEDLPR